MNIWERLLREFQAGFAMGGPGMENRPDTSGLRGTGAQKNFALDKKGSEWPYEDDDMMNYGVPSGPRGLDRGTKTGTDVHGGPPTPSSTYLKTWQNEAAGQPSRIGPFAPFDGPALHGSPNAGPVEDEEGDPIPSTDDAEFSVEDPKLGPNNMWGGAGTVPGQDRGWAASPMMGNEPEDIWKVPEDEKMNELKEFFDPSPLNAEEVENPEQTHEKDQSDEELEGMMGGEEDGHKSSEHEGGEEETAGVVMLDDEPAGIMSMGSEEMGGEPEGEEAPGDADADLPGPGAQDDAADFQLTVEPEAGELPKLSQFMDPQDHLVGGAPGTLGLPAATTARGLHGMKPDAKGLVPPGHSAWDEIAMQIGDAVINFKKNPAAAPVAESVWDTMKRGAAGLALGGALAGGSPAMAAEPRYPDVDLQAMKQYVDVPDMKFNDVYYGENNPQSSRELQGNLHKSSKGSTKGSAKASHASAWDQLQDPNLWAKK